MKPRNQISCKYCPVSTFSTNANIHFQVIIQLWEGQESLILSFSTVCSYNVEPKLKALCIHYKMSFYLNGLLFSAVVTFFPFQSFTFLVLVVFSSFGLRHPSSLTDRGHCASLFQLLDILIFSICFYNNYKSFY